MKKKLQEKSDKITTMNKRGGGHGEFIPLVSKIWFVYQKEYYTGKIVKL